MGVGPDIDKLVASFLKHNINVVRAPSGKEAGDLVLHMIPDGATVGCGGSQTIRDIGLIANIKKGNYVLFDRHSAEKGTTQYDHLARLAQHADYFISGTNAITEDGKIVNVDRKGNRVSALLFGPEKVVIIAGLNKIVKDEEAAYARIKAVAAPLNAQRKGLDTPCADLGYCVDCDSPDRICYSKVTIERQPANRMTLVLINEEIGY